MTHIKTNRSDVARGDEVGWMGNIRCCAMQRWSRHKYKYTKYKIHQIQIQKPTEICMLPCQHDLIMLDEIFDTEKRLCVCVCDFISGAMLVDHEQLRHAKKAAPVCQVVMMWLWLPYYRSRILGAGRFTKMAPPLITRCATWRRTNQLNIPSSICDISLKCSVFSGKCPHPVNWPAPKRIWGRLKKPKRRLVSLTILSQLSLSKKFDAFC